MEFSGMGFCSVGISEIYYELFRKEAVMNKMIICMVFLFLLYVMPYGQTPSSIPASASKIANTNIVAKSGGDYDTIQSAVDAAQAGTTIVVYPGEYAEKVTLKDGVSLVGTDRKNCIIRKDVAGNGSLGEHLVTLTNGEVRNLTLNNTHAGYSSTAIMITGGGIVENCDLLATYHDVVIFNGTGGRISNCYITGGQDTVSCAQGTAIIDNCTVICSINDPLWIGNGNQTVIITDTILQSMNNLAGIMITGDSGKTINVYAFGVRCVGSKYSAIPFVYESSYGTGTAINYENCVFSEYGNTHVTFAPIKGGILDLVSLQIGGKNAIDSSRNVSGNTLSSGGNIVADTSGRLASYTTTWKDFPACQGLNASSVENTGQSTSSAGTHYHNVSVSNGDNSWRPAAGNDVTYMHCTADAKCLLFPVLYEAGTVLTQMRVKWQAEGNNDGVKVRLVKRDENGMATGWTIVGAQRTFTDAKSPYDVTVSTYDLTPDETMAANHSYSIEVESEKVTSGVKLFSVGVETSKRVY